MRSAIFIIVFAIAALSIRAAVIVPKLREPDDGVVQAWRDNTQNEREASIGDRITVVLKNFDDWLMKQEENSFPIPGHSSDVDDPNLRKAIQDPAFREAVKAYNRGDSEGTHENAQLLKEAKTLIDSKINGLTLEINELALKGTTPVPGDSGPLDSNSGQKNVPYYQWVAFELVQTDDNSVNWDRLRRNMFIKAPVTLTVVTNIDGRIVDLPTAIMPQGAAWDPFQFQLKLVPEGKFYAAILVVLAFIALFVRLAFGTDLIRDPDRPRRADGRQPFSLTTLL